MRNIKLIFTTALVATALVAPAAAQSIYDRTEGNGNVTKLGTFERSYAAETVAPVAGPGDVRSGNITKRGPARYYGAYEDYGYGAWYGDRTMGYGNRSKLGQY